MISPFGHAWTDMAHPILSRMLFSKIVLVLSIISLVWTVAIFLAPATLPSGEVADLDGLANHIDYEARWAELPLPHAIVYYIGDVECHQISERSFYVAGNQMPVCSRDTGIFLFATIGLFMAMVARPASSVSRMLIRMLPRRARSFVEGRIPEFWFLVITAGVFLVPLALDGGLQLFTGYESTNAARLLTGSFAGWFGGFVFGALLISTKVVTSSGQSPAATNG